MNEKVVQKWTAALRSGAYKQGDGALRTEDNYCCLGVLCDLYSKEHDDSGWREDDRDHTGVIPFATPSSSTLTETAQLPVEVMEWVGISDPEGTFGESNSLVLCNDSGASFEAIANLIDGRPKGLFQQTEQEIAERLMGQDA